MPRVTPDELRRELAGAHARKAKLEEEIQLLEALLNLHSAPDRSNVGPMLQESEAPRGVKIAAGRARNLTPSRLACIEAELSDAMVARLTKCGRSTVQAWHNGERAIQRGAANILAAYKRHAEGPKKGQPMIPTSVWKRIQD